MNATTKSEFRSVRRELINKYLHLGYKTTGTLRQCVRYDECIIYGGEPPIDNMVYTCSKCGKEISGADADDNGGICTACTWEGWDFGGGVDDPSY
jgi:hypothetical protein